MGDTYCSTTPISYKMFCCIGNTLSTLTKTQLSNKTTTLHTLVGCFGDCEEANHMELFTQTVEILMGHGTGDRKLHGCKTFQNPCKNPTTPVNVSFVVILTAMLFMALMGNTTVIVAIIYTRKLRCSPSGMFILSLAVSDLLVAVFIVPLKVSRVR